MKFIFVECDKCGHRVALSRKEAWSKLNSIRTPAKADASRRNARMQQGKPKPGRYEWASVDWSQRDSEIARALGCSNTAVRTRRLQKSLYTITTKEAIRKAKGDHGSKAAAASRTGRLAGGLHRRTRGRAVTIRTARRVRDQEGSTPHGRIPSEQVTALPKLPEPSEVGRLGAYGCTRGQLLDLVAKYPWTAGLSVRALNCLSSTPWRCEGAGLEDGKCVLDGYPTPEALRQAINTSKLKLRKIRNLGKKTEREICAFVGAGTPP